MAARFGYRRPTIPSAGRDGKPYKIVKFATDVTAETLRSIDYAGQIKALHQSQAVIELALDGIILSANDKFLDAFGYSQSEIVGRPHSIFVEEAYRSSEDYRRFWEGLKRGEYQSGEYRRVAKNGAPVYIQASYNPISDRDGRPLKIVKFATDITLQVEDRLRRAELQSLVGRDLNDIGQATSDVAKQAEDAAKTATSVLTDVGAMISGADRMFNASDAISLQVGAGLVDRRPGLRPGR